LQLLLFLTPKTLFFKSCVPFLISALYKFDLVLIQRQDPRAKIGKLVSFKSIRSIYAYIYIQRNSFGDTIHPKQKARRKVLEGISASTAVCAPWLNIHFCVFLFWRLEMEKNAMIYGGEKIGMAESILSLPKESYLHQESTHVEINSRNTLAHTISTARARSTS
jgi:hypothetical protein